MYQAKTPHEAQAGLAPFAEQWRTTQPKAVFIFEHEFEQTIRYFALTGAVREVVRTTSLLERTNPKLRHKFRQEGCFSSSSGVKVAVYIQVTRPYAQWDKTSWWEAYLLITLELLHSNL